jgi:hypothetical protein
LSTGLPFPASAIPAVAASANSEAPAPTNILRPDIVVPFDSNLVVVQKARSYEGFTKARLSRDGRRLTFS